MQLPMHSQALTCSTLRAFPVRVASASALSTAVFLHVFLWPRRAPLNPCPQTFGRRIPFAFLDDIRSRFAATYGAAAKEVRQAYGRRTAMAQEHLMGRRRCTTVMWAPCCAPGRSPGRPSHRPCAPSAAHTTKPASSPTTALAPASISLGDLGLSPYIPRFRRKGDRPCLLHIPACTPARPLPPAFAVPTLAPCWPLPCGPQAVAYEYNTEFSRVLADRAAYFSDPSSDAINRVKVGRAPRRGASGWGEKESRQGSRCC